MTLPGNEVLGVLPICWWMARGLNADAREFDAVDSMAATQISLTDAVICSANNHCSPHPEIKRIKYEENCHISSIENMLTEPVSEMPAPDKLSANKRSLSGSACPRDDSDLFFRIDLDRLCDSTPGVDSMESCESDSFSVFPAIKMRTKQFSKKKNRNENGWMGRRTPLLTLHLWNIIL